MRAFDFHIPTDFILACAEPQRDVYDYIIREGVTKYLSEHPGSVFKEIAGSRANPNGSITVDLRFWVPKEKTCSA